MKKIISVLSVVGLAASLAACSPAPDKTRTSQYRPMNAATTNPAAPLVGYDKQYNYNYNAPGYGRYTTSGTGVVKDQSTTRPGAMYDSRDRIMHSQGMTNMGITSGGQRVYTSGNPLSRPSTYTSTKSTVGYVHLTDKQTAPTGKYVDRQLLASSVANAVKPTAGVKGVTVLATDNQIFVGCDTKGLSSSAAHQVLIKARKAAEHLAPRYYKVYVTNNLGAIAKVQKNPSHLIGKTQAQFEQMLGYKPKAADFLVTAPAYK